MTQPLTLNDRLRIETVVWGLDQRLYDLPRRRRIEIRREVRDNLRTAAVDVGARAAVRNIGSAADLATGYLDAELGGGRRASWLAAATFVFTALLILQSVLTDSANAFGEGVLTADPSFSGTQRWSGVSLLQTEVTATFGDHTSTFTGGALSVWGYLLLALGGVAVGRLWRALPSRAAVEADR